MAPAVTNNHPMNIRPGPGAFHGGVGVCNSTLGGHPAKNPFPGSDAEGGGFAPHFLERTKTNPTRRRVILPHITQAQPGGISGGIAAAPREGVHSPPENRPKTW